MNLTPLARALLWPLSLLYGAAVRVRAGLYERGWLARKRLRGTVISVGNVSVGGTGKTPAVIWLAQQFLARGKRVAILSRGYRGSGGTSDEIELMKQRLGGQVLFGVGKDRFAEGRPLESAGIDVFILDDGFQHMQLARDVDIVLVDGSRPAGAKSLLPAGRLREPLSALRRADMVILSRAENDPRTKAVGQGLGKVPVFAARTRLLGFRPLAGGSTLHGVAEMGAGPFFAFCGIGNPQAFVQDLGRWRVPLAGSMFFGDHHHYSIKDVLAVEQAAKQAGAAGLVTTEKDAQNLAGLEFRDVPGVQAAVIALDFDDEGALMAAIDIALGARAGAAG